MEFERWIKSHIDIVVLSELKDGRKCGHDIIESINERYGVLVSHGTIYPLLDNLSQKGILNMHIVSRSKVYCPTEKGKKYFNVKIDEIKEVEERTSKILEKFPIYGTLDSY